MKLRCAIAILALLTLPVLAADTAPAKSPLLVMLITRLDDFVRINVTEDRIQRTLASLEKLRATYPDANIRILFQASGQVAERLQARNNTTHLVDRLKEAQQKGLIELGYNGWGEPTFRNRPRAIFPSDASPADRWRIRYETAENFLTYAKNPATGDPAPGLSGGLKRFSEVFGPAASVNRYQELVGGDEPTVHLISKLGQKPVFLSVRASDPEMGIRGYSGSVSTALRLLSPAPDTAMEVFRETSRIRVSEYNPPQIRPLSTDEPEADFQKTLVGVNLARPRLVQIEYTSYIRYLVTRADRSVLYHPLVWAFDHPGDPIPPTTIPTYNQTHIINKGYDLEAKNMKWLIEQFLPTVPGSRFVTPNDLQAMSTDIVGTEINREMIDAVAQAVKDGYAKHPSFPPDYVKAKDTYFSLAEAFQVLVRAVGERSATGKLPQSMKVLPIYGPLEFNRDNGPNTGEVSLAAVAKVASDISSQIADTTMSVVPKNTVPARAGVEGKVLTASQFLSILAVAYFAEDWSAKVPLRMNQGVTTLSEVMPANIALQDTGNYWTLKPAALRLTPAQ